VGFLRFIYRTLKLLKGVDLSENRVKTHKNISFDVPHEDHQDLKKIASHRGQTLAQLMRDLVYSSNILSEVNKIRESDIFSQKPLERLDKKKTQISFFDHSVDDDNNLK
jgi:predicted DNA-binding protein